MVPRTWACHSDIRGKGCCEVLIQQSGTKGEGLLPLIHFIGKWQQVAQGVSLQRSSEEGAEVSLPGEGAMRGMTITAPGAPCGTGNICSWQHTRLCLKGTKGHQESVAGSTSVNDQGQIGETIFAKSFTEIILYGKIFSLTDTWAEVEPPSYSVTSFVFISGLSLVPTLRRQTRGFRRRQTVVVYDPGHLHLGSAQNWVHNIRA